MYDRMISTYTDLMDKLNSLPVEIAESEDEMIALKKGVVHHEDAMERRRIALIFAAGGWAALGKNEGERSMAEKKMLSEDKAYQDAAAAFTNLRIDIDVTAQRIKDSERQYGAVCYQARLTAAFMGFLAGAGVTTEQPMEAPMSAEEVGL